MAKRKRSGKRTTSHQATDNVLPSTSAEQPQNLDYEDAVNEGDELPVEEEEIAEEEDYVWDSKPLKSSRNGLFGSGPKGYVDPGTNQRGAFPELQGLDDDVDLSTPAADGLSYLRMVRHEARGVPNLLTASQFRGSAPGIKASAIVIAAPAPTPVSTGRPVPTNVDSLLYDDDNVAAYNEAAAQKVSNDTENAAMKDGESKPNVTEYGRLSYNDESNYPENEDADDWDGEEWDEDVDDEYSDSGSSAYYDDGAYIARPAPTLPTALPQKAIPPRVISQDWHNSLLTNFRATRDAIVTTPFEESEETFPAIPTEWRDFMVENQPSLPILQSITSENAIKALKHVRKNVGWANVHEWQGKWIWALLARANDVGILMNEEVSVIRELGKKAVFNLGKAADAREKLVESGGRDWWDEELQGKLFEYMYSGGQAEQPVAVDGMVDVHVEDWDGGVKLDDQVEIPIEDAANKSGEDAAEGRPLKKMALFKPRVMVVSKPKTVSGLAVPSISVIPATPEGNNFDSPMEDSLSSGAEAVPPQTQHKPDITHTDVSSATEEKPEDSKEDNRKESDVGTITHRIPDVKTLFALDMIVSVVGEMFGQRDLLLERR